MTPERFHLIVEAYGADPHRWPQHERADAETWARQHPDEAGAALSESAGIDDWLAGYAIAPPAQALRQRIVDSAPVGRAPWLRKRMWWSGAAVAGVGLMGGLAGAFAVSFFVTTGTVPPVHDTSYLTTSFGGSTADWSGE